MTLVELTYFPGEGRHRSPIVVNPDYVVFLIGADSGIDGDQCWIRLRGHNLDFLVQGDLRKVAARLAGDPT